MLKMSEMRHSELPDVALSPSLPRRDVSFLRNDGLFRLLRQMLRFGLVGGLNTLIDLLVLNCLLWLFAPTEAPQLLACNALAYGVGALNSFVWNKYWTFSQRQRATHQELVRFAVTTGLGMGLNCLMLWAVSLALHPALVNPVIWANVSKVFAIAVTMLISYVGMRVWVFANGELREPIRLSDYRTGREQQSAAAAKTSAGDKQSPASEREGGPGRGHSLSVVLPAYNEEQIIAATLSEVFDALQAWQIDFEILVVNDGSTDRTEEIVSCFAAMHERIHLISHPVNQGYGAALVSGFRAARKELTFFMDTDGQFAISELSQFFPLIDEYDAVIGYRLDRQDTWLRKCNAWGWKLLVRGVLNVQVRDIDCAFKLFQTDFLHRYPLETRGAMINAELLYKLKQSNRTCWEIGVLHLPRQSGRATGARPRVIARALRDLFVYARRWRRVAAQRSVVSEQQQHI